MKRKLLSLCLVLSMLFGAAAPASAAAGTEKHSKFITGVTFLWTYDGNWKPAAPGDQYHVDTAVTLGKGASNIRMYPYTRENFEISKATEGARNKDEYNDQYMDYAVKNMSIQQTSQPDENGKITYSYQFDLRSDRKFDVAAKLRKNEEQEIRNLMGYVSPEMEQFFAAARNGGLNQGIQAQLYFMPYIIEWETPLVTCSVCGKCKLHDGTVCAPGTCDNWNTPDCGCYRPPFIEPEQPVAPPDTNGCSSVIQWSETKPHTYYCGGCLMGGGCPGHTCHHVYTYQTALVAKATVTPDTLKSGYGFSVKVDNKINSGQISNQGVCGKSLKKAYSNVPKPPAAAEVWLSWKVKNRLGTQPTAVQLEKSGSTATTSSFQPKKNKISEIKARKIYTDVAMKGTKKKPVSHPFQIVISGGGVKGIPFCQQIVKNITINGDMYEDDFTVDRKAK